MHNLKFLWEDRVVHNNNFLREKYTQPPSEKIQMENS